MVTKQKIKEGKSLYCVGTSLRYFIFKTQTKVQMVFQANGVSSCLKTQRNRITSFISKNLWNTTEHDSNHIYRTDSQNITSTYWTVSEHRYVSEWSKWNKKKSFRRLFRLLNTKLTTELFLSPSVHLMRMPIPLILFMFVYDVFEKAHDLYWPAPLVTTSFGLLRAPSPLVVYAATVME